ncbi:protamine P1 [Colletotrichum tofieldiae]|nr:protamine P1 [Colletotrichum tofieldiae]
MDLEEGWRVRCLDDEPIYCEAPHDETEVLYAGSDDEYYDNPNERKSRYEKAAIRFFQGHTPVLLTTVLRGPFEGPDAKGWVNPWQSRKKPAPTASTPTSEPQPVPEPTSDPEIETFEALESGSTTSCHLPSPRSLDQVGITPHPFMEEEELERVKAWRSTTESSGKMVEDAWSFSASLPQSQSQSRRKRRPAGSEWLKRNDNKRRKAGKAHNVEGSSVTVQYNTPSLRRDLSDSRPHPQRKQQVFIAEDDRTSLERPEANSRLRPKSSEGITTRSSQQLLSQVCDKHHDASQEMTASLSTPIQTPQSSRKSKMKPRTVTHESKPFSNGVVMAGQEACGAVGVKDEYETQQDESFLFRARPREHVLDITHLSPIRRMSFGRVSSPASTAPSEMDSHGKLLDLDGDTCMADDTKATSPESSAEDNEHDEDSLKKNTTLVVEQVTEGESETDGSQSEHLSGTSPPGHTEDTLDATNPTSVEGLEHVEAAHQSMSTEQGVVAEVITDRSSQEPTVIAHSGSQEEKDKESADGVSRVPLPPTPAKQFPGSAQSITQPSTSHISTMPKPFPQSPWSKLSQFNTSTPCRTSGSGENPQHLSDVVATIGRGTPTQHAPTTPSTASLQREPTSKSMKSIHQQEVEPLRFCGNARVGEMISQAGSPAVPASQQSPWKADVPAMALPQQQRLPTESGDGSFMDPDCQSPWTASPERMRQAAQEALMSRSFIVARPVSPSPLALPALMEPNALVVNLASEHKQPVAAETMRSSSPEPVFSIKSFANFLSPSPERPRRRSNRIRLSDGHLPSTQNLIAATTDNPWESVPKSYKRVKWASLPHEDDRDEDGGPQTPTGPRASSPPPEMAVADLPTGDDDQYQKHFQAVSRRKKLHHHLLPSASQQVLESPAPMAMAEAFVAADSFRAPPALEAAMYSGEASSLPKNDESQESVLDDVDDVLRNLNEFIEMVDVEADLARAKEEEEKENIRRQQQQQQSQRPSGFSFDGILDGGVWD